MRVTPEAGLRDDYELKLNSYDLGVDIELHDAVQRLRFEHPEVGAVVLTGGLDKVFCAGANIQMLAGSTHAHKVGFCKFTNETRNAIEDATAHSGQVWIAAVNGTAAGGGYELALACDEILLVDDRSSAVSLPEVPLLAVLPGTGGLTRVVDKRHVRRDLADVFATRAEGVKGQQALDWGLVDAIAPRSRFDETVRDRALARAGDDDRDPSGADGRRAHPAARRRRRRRPALRPRRRGHRPRRRRRPPHRARPERGPGGRPRRARRRRVGARRASPARRRHAAAALRRARGRHVGAPHRGRRRTPCWPPRTCCAPTPTTGSSTRSGCSGPACSSASTSPPARSSRWSSRAAASPGVLAELALAADRSFMLDGPGPRRRRAAGQRSTSPTPTTGGSRWPTA